MLCDIALGKFLHHERFSFEFPLIRWVTTICDDTQPVLRFLTNPLQFYDSKFAKGGATFPSVFCPVVQVEDFFPLRRDAALEAAYLSIVKNNTLAGWLDGLNQSGGQFDAQNTIFQKALGRSWVATFSLSHGQLSH
jgi:hypothetical protein